MSCIRDRGVRYCEDAVWEFVIPQAMKDSVQYEGQARFSKEIEYNNFDRALSRE